jgi:hypothetical protein
MSGVVRIEIVETPEKLKDLMRQEKDVLRHEKLQVLYWLKTQAVDSILSAAVRRRETSYHNTKMVISLPLRGNRRIIIAETSFGKTKNNES